MVKDDEESRDLRFNQPLGYRVYRRGTPGIHIDGRDTAMSEDSDDQLKIDSPRSVNKRDAPADGEPDWHFYTPAQTSYSARDSNAHPHSLEPHQFLTEAELQSLGASRTEATLFLQALRQKDLTTMRNLLANGFDVNDRDDEDQTPLHFAASRGHDETVRLLLEYGASIDTQNLYGYTPLMFAAQNCQLNTVRLLLAEGADLDKEVPVYKEGRHMFNQTALSLAVDNGCTDVAELLKDYVRADK